MYYVFVSQHPAASTEVLNLLAEHLWNFATHGPWLVVPVGVAYLHSSSVDSRSPTC